MNEDNKPEKSVETIDCAEQKHVNSDVPTQPPFTTYPVGSFPAELETLINKHSIENGSDTPDFILAEYLKQCLETFDMCVRRRKEWYS